MWLQGPKENENSSREKRQSHIGAAKYWRKRVERVSLFERHEWIGYVYNYVLYHNAKVADLNQRRRLAFEKRKSYDEQNKA